MATKLITPEFRGSFVHLVKPHAPKGQPDAKPRFQITAPISKTDPFWKKVEALIQETAIGKWGKVPPKMKSPIKDGDAEERPEFEGCFVIQASSNNKPDAVDKNLQPIMSEEELYSGAWYRASIRAYAWDHPTGGKGVSIALDNVMKVRDDEHFSGRTRAEDDFADFADASDNASLLD